MKVAKTLLAIAIVAALIIGVSFAQEQGQTQTRTERQARMREAFGRTRGQFGTRFGAGRNPARTVIRLQQQLELTEEQVAKLEKIQPADPNAAQKAQQELLQIHQALNAVVIAADTGKIKELCKKLGAATEKTSLLAAREYRQIKRILTAEQFKNLQQLLTAPRRMPGTTGAAGQRQGQGVRQGARQRGERTPN